MSEEEIRKMCSNIYEGEYWQPMIDLVQSKDKEIERLNNIIGETIDRAIHLQKTFGYVLDDLVYLLMQGSDK